VSSHSRAPGIALEAPAGFPAPPDPAAYHGLVGEVVERLEPCTEADPAAVLAQLLVCCGAMIGRGAYFLVEATRHHANEFVVLVGESAKARKGSSFDHVAKLMTAADGSFAGRCSTGLSSGEGLIWALRDREGNDPGAGDPRLLVIEPEFASVLKGVNRDVSTLSPVLRSAWDGRPLALLTRSAPARASAAHLSLIGHITSAELVHHATSLEVANGLLNRFLFVACRRVRLLPEGGEPDPLAGSGLAGRLNKNLRQGARRGELGLSQSARADWRDIYLSMAAAEEGLVGGLLARSEAHVLRLSMCYALIDGADVIGAEHLAAGLALQEYSARSVRAIFGAASGNERAEQIHRSLSASGPMTRTDLRDLFGRNHHKTDIDEALRALEAAGRAESVRIVTGGRPAEVWRARPANAPAR
jgi:hypothetical protein